MARAFLAVCAVALGLLLSPYSHAAVPQITQPTWVELSPQQKQILAPLAGEWDKLESWRRKKWVDVAKRYPAMKPEEQQRVQRRMSDWAKLTPQERDVARKEYKDLKKAPPEHKEAIKQKWQEYKELPEDEKKRLKAQAAAKPIPKNTASKPLTSSLAPRPAQPTVPNAVPAAPAMQ